MSIAAAPGDVVGAPYRLPSVGRRIVGAVGRLVPLLFLYVGLPYFALRAADQLGAKVPFDLPTLGLLGALIAVLSVAAYLAKPTRAFGPISLMGSLAAIGYIAWLLPHASVSLAVGNDVTFTLGYHDLLELLLIVPAISAVSAFVTTLEDASDPGARLPFDFPP